SGETSSRELDDPAKAGAARRATASGGKNRMEGMDSSRDCGKAFTTKAQRSHGGTQRKRAVRLALLCVSSASPLCLCGERPGLVSERRSGHRYFLPPSFSARSLTSLVIVQRCSSYSSPS